MKNSCKKENGITLMSLVITIVILIILASIATYSGIEVIKSSKLTKFTTEMRIMQTQVNELYQKMQDGDTTIKELGKIISEIGNQTQVNNVFNAVGITTKDEREQYKYFDKEISLEEATSLIKKNSRHYAKRQYTWFNNKMTIKWFDVDFNNFNNTIKDVESYILSCHE